MHTNVMMVPYQGAIACSLGFPMSKINVLLIVKWLFIHIAKDFGH